MISRDFGKILLAVSGISFVLAGARLAWLTRAYSLGFDLPGTLRMWGGWVLLWLLITVAGFLLLFVKRSRSA